MLQLGFALEVDAGQLGRIDALYLSATLYDAVLVEVDHDVPEHAGGFLVDVVGQAQIRDRGFRTSARMVVQQVIAVRAEGLHVVADLLGDVVRYAHDRRQATRITVLTDDAAVLDEEGAEGLESRIAIDLRQGGEVRRAAYFLPEELVCFSGDEAVIESGAE